MKPFIGAVLLFPAFFAMIKTVSFAPPRAQTSRPARSKAAPKRASGSSQSSNFVEQPSLFSSLSEAEPVDAISAAQIPSRAPKAALAKKSSAPAEKVAAQPAVTAAPEIAVAPKKVKVKRAKVPENLAESYGAKVSKRVELGQTEIPEVEAPKKRMTKAEREARKQLIRPDEDLLKRLQRATTLAPAKKEPKPKGWRFDCGRCGRTLFFQTSGALCACGAIAVKE